MKYFIILSLLAFEICAAQVALKQQALDRLVFAQLPGTTPVWIPPNRKMPVISKADIVMAATDNVGILVNNLAHDLAVDLNSILNFQSETPSSPSEPAWL